MRNKIHSKTMEKARFPLKAMHPNKSMRFQRFNNLLLKQVSNDYLS